MAIPEHIQFPDSLSGQNSRPRRWLLFLLYVLMASGEDLSQATSAITPTTGTGDLGTVVTHNGTTYTITGGTRPGGGPNLFHSFGDFSVPAGNVANFFNETPTIATANILGRVTGPNISNIYGTIQTTGFGDANLFLMNPAGIVFGPAASLNVGGSVTFTTANYLRLADNGRFTTILDATADTLLSAAPIAAYGFLGSNLGAITVHGSELTVANQHGISLVGGHVLITSASGENPTKPALISASGGQVNLVSVASPGEITGPNFKSAPAVLLGSVTLSQGSTVTVSGDAAGTVRIRAGRLIVNDAMISADTGAHHGATVAVDIATTDAVSLSDSRGLPAITAQTNGPGNAGSIEIRSAELSASSTSPNLFALIDSHTSGSGKGGNVSISTTRKIDVTGAPDGFTLLIDSGTIGPAENQGGHVSLTAEAITLADTAISTGDTVATFTGQRAVGSGGNVAIAADTLRLSHTLISTDAFFAGQAGNLTITAKMIQTAGDSILTSKGFGGGGNLRITTDSLASDSTQFETGTVSGPGGEIVIQAKSVELKNGSSMRTRTAGDNDAGNIHIDARDHIILSDRFTFLGDPETLSAYTRPTGLFTNSAGLTGTHGNAGTIDIHTPRLEIVGGARIDSSTQGSGRGGNINIHSDIVSISKERPLGVPEQDIFGLGSSRASGIFARTVGSEFCTEVCGSAGNISITTNTLLMGAGSQINSGTTSSGLGGNITIHSGNQINLSGTLADGTPVGIFSRTVGTTPDAGSGGNISLKAGQSVTIQNGASVSASSTGPADAGNISINAGQQLDLTEKSSITTEAKQASGGNIDITAVDLIRVANSTISSSVQGNLSTAGGNITIDPNTVVLQKGQILASAVHGSGGHITITTPTFLPDQFSRIDASSQFGVNGTVTVQSPTSNLSGTVKQLTSKPSEAQALLQNRCVALAGGEQSTFIVAGRDALPSEPGGWLSSPLSINHLPGHDAKHATGPTTKRVGPHRSPAMVVPVRETQALSLRRLTPTGFLVRTFGIDGLTGCRS